MACLSWPSQSLAQGSGQRFSLRDLHCADFELPIYMISLLHLISELTWSSRSSSARLSAHQGLSPRVGRTYDVDRGSCHQEHGCKTWSYRSDCFNQWVDSLSHACNLISVATNYHGARLDHPLRRRMPGTPGLPPRATVSPFLVPLRICVRCGQERGFASQHV